MNSHPVHLVETPLSNNAARLRRRLLRLVGSAIEDYRMIRDGDRILACVSGGKDSFAMLDMLLTLQKRAPVSFEIIAMNLDQKQPGFPDQVLPAYFQRHNIPHKIVTEDTYSIVKEKIPEGQTTCSLCSRLRRGKIYRTAKELNANVVALGHHLDDIVETFFLNLFHGGRIKAMPPKLLTDDGMHTVIRPLAYCRERDLARFANQKNFPIIPCNLCGSQDNLQRQAIKQMLLQWEKTHPNRTQTIFRALQHVTVSHLADQNLYDFATLMAQLPQAEQVARTGQDGRFFSADFTSDKGDPPAG